VKKVLVLDNYDSFTYNLVQYLGELGAAVTVKRNDEITVHEVGSLGVGGIIVSPGPCTPREAGISIDLIKTWSGRLPILGVCLGHQAIGAAFGGVVIRAPEIMHGKTSEIVHDGEGVYRGVPSPFTATRYHSLCVEEASLPDVMKVTSRVAGLAPPNAAIRGGGGTASHPGAASGDPIMGLRHKSHPTEGVQFHPESILTDVGHALLRNFLEIL
jgi:anthranilate synthase/aminodeoxychorismate synthase-like glutamine amidotransferase